jgi:hypothetical protein
MSLTPAQIKYRGRIYKQAAVRISKLRVDDSHRAGGAEQTSRLFVWIDNEKVLDNLHDRYKRPWQLWKAEVLPQVFKRLKLPRDTLTKWSQTAGCSCGCSPGFIVYDGKNQDYHVFVS